MLACAALALLAAVSSLVARLLRHVFQEVARIGLGLLTSRERDVSLGSL